MGGELEREGERKEGGQERVGGGGEERVGEKEKGMGENERGEKGGRARKDQDPRGEQEWRGE